MRLTRAPVSVRFVMALGVLLAGISGCKVLPQGHQQGTRYLGLAPAGPSVLVVISDPESAAVMRATGALVEGTVRASERVIILSARGGALLASGKVPGSPSMSVADPPVAPRHPTAFQRARYEHAVEKYRTMVSRDRAALVSRRREQLSAWAAALVGRAASLPDPQSTQGTNVGTDLGAASSTVASMRQAWPALRNARRHRGHGRGPGRRADADRRWQASTVVVNDFPGSTAAQAAWQSSLVQDGAARAVVLTPATSDQLVSVVRQGLDGAITDTLTSVLFARGQYALQPAALPQLRHLLHLLAVTYPHATATVNGYAETCPCRALVAISRCPGGVRRQYCGGWSRTTSQPVGFRPSATATPTPWRPTHPAASRSTGASSLSSTRR